MSSIGRPLHNQQLKTQIFGITAPIRNPEGKVIGALARQGCHACHAYQGYLFSRPLPLKQFEMFMGQLDTDVVDSCA